MFYFVSYSKIRDVLKHVYMLCNAKTGVGPTFTWWNEDWYIETDEHPCSVHTCFQDGDYWGGNHSLLPPAPGHPPWAPWLHQELCQVWKVTYQETSYNETVSSSELMLFKASKQPSNKSYTPYNQQHGWFSLNRSLGRFSLADAMSVCCMHVVCIYVCCVYAFPSPYKYFWRSSSVGYNH